MGHKSSLSRGSPCRVFVAESAGAGSRTEDRGTGSTSEYANQPKDCGEGDDTLIESGAGMEDCSEEVATGSGKLQVS
jgi:hypothetical protein